MYRLFQLFRRGVVLFYCCEDICWADDAMVDGVFFLQMLGHILFFTMRFLHFVYMLFILLLAQVGMRSFENWS